MYIEFLVTCGVYFTIIVGIGIAASRATSSSKSSEKNHDFLLGGRQTHWLATALSAHAADMSDWLFMGLPAAIYLRGGFEIWIVIGLLCGMFLSWHCIAARLRTSSIQYNAHTLTAYFANRLDDRSGILVTIAALISLFFFTIYLSVGLKGIGYVLNSAFGLNYHIGIIMGAAVVLSYTLIGGFTAVAWIDLFQGIFLLCMLLGVALYTAYDVHHTIGFAQLLQATPVSFSIVPHSWTEGMAVLLNPFSWCLGYFGMPHILTKFMGSRNTHELYKAKYVGVSWQLLATGSAVLIGVIAHAYFPAAIPGKTEFIFIALAKTLFNPWLASIILCAILAATISTVDSQLLVLASIFAHDVYTKMVHPTACSARVLLVYRIALVCSALAGLTIAWQQESTIMTLVRYAWAGLGASFGPLLLVSLYSSWINRWGGIAGILTGALVSVLWSYYNPLVYGITVYAIVPGFIASFVVMYVLSKATQRHDHQDT